MSVSSETTISTSGEVSTRTTQTPLSCIYRTSGTKLKPSISGTTSTVVFPGGQKIELVSDNTIQFTFTTLRTIDEVTIQTTSATVFTLTTMDRDGEQLGAERTVTSADLPQVTAIEPAQSGVQIVQLTATSPFNIDDLISVEVHACKENDVTTTPVESTTPSGQWLTWGPWSKCTAECGKDDVIVRKRYCTIPAPENQGLACPGNDEEEMECIGECNSTTQVPNNPCLLEFSGADLSDEQAIDIGSGSTAQYNAKEKEITILLGETSVLSKATLKGANGVTITPLLPNGDEGEPITINGNFDEASMTDMPNLLIRGVVIRKDGGLNPSDIILFHLSACAKAEPGSCLNEFSGADIADEQAVDIGSGSTAQYNAEARDVTILLGEISVLSKATLKGASGVTVTPLLPNGDEGEPITINGSFDEASMTDMPNLLIRGVVLRRDGGLNPSDITLFHLSACAETSTSQSTSQPPTSQSTSPIPTVTTPGCTVGDWSTFTPCSVSCDLGSKMRQRDVSDSCGSDTLAIEETDCNPQACEQNCQWSTWGLWGNCTVECNGGIQKRDRSILRQGKTLDTKCTEPNMETESCNTNKCEVVDLCTEGKVWVTCAHKCPLTCSDLGSTGSTCVEDEDCEPGCRCPGIMVANDDGACVNRDQCSCQGNNGTVYSPGQTFDDEDNCKKCECTHDGLNCTEYECAVDCEYSEWTNWGVCSKECDGGNQYRYRTPGTAQGGGQECDKEEKEQRDCNQQTCDEVITTVEPREYSLCSLSPQTTDLTAGSCVAKNVTLDVCKGSCPSSQSTTSLSTEQGGMFTFVSQCYCCKGEMTYTDVTFMCQGGDAKTIAVPHHLTCGCELCSEESSDNI
jgi:hypothetical protein